MKNKNITFNVDQETRLIAQNLLCRLITFDEDRERLFGNPEAEEKFLKLLCIISGANYSFSIKKIE